MRKIALSLLLFLPYLLFAQASRIVVEGKVTDVLHKPIAYATIQSIGTADGSNTDIIGHYIFRTTLPTTLKASFIGYKIAFKKISATIGKDTLQVDFVLEFDSTQLQQVQITATHQPELLKESGLLIDFETYQNKLWFLYDYSKGEHLEIYDTGMHYINRMVLKYNSDNLNLTPYNYLYVANSDSVRLFDYDTIDKLIDVGGVTANEFHHFINRLVTYNAPYYYYAWTGIDSSFINYWYIDKNTRKFNVLYYYKNNEIARQNDDLLFEMYGLDMDLYDDNGMPKAMSEKGEARGTDSPYPGDSRATEDLITLLKVLAKGIFCPFRMIRDSIYIFNFDNDSIYVYTINNTRIRQMPLPFSVDGLKYKERDILVNEEGTECYFKFIVDGIAYLQKIDLNNGTKINTQKIGFPFPEKIRVMAGYAYYTYSDAQINGMFVRHLYRQKID